jgi:hypothetical protein
MSSKSTPVITGGAVWHSGEDFICVAAMFRVYWFFAPLALVA